MFMELLKQILECKDEEVDFIIKDAISKANANSQKVERLGFLSCITANNLFKGFIPLDTRIKYMSLSMEDYGMQTTDFFYEFAYFIRKYNINSKGKLIYSLEYFINSYFGLPGKVDRETLFNDMAFQNTTTDSEYFEALENNKIGDLKGKGAAQCTERAALAQQLLSLFDFESYYCIGCVEFDNKQEPHCFNVVKRQNDYALLDYSVPVNLYNLEGNVKAFYPFVGEIKKEEFFDFINNETIKSFDNYNYAINNQKMLTGYKRNYVVGVYEMQKERAKANR